MACEASRSCVVDAIFIYGVIIYIYFFSEKKKKKKRRRKKRVKEATTIYRISTVHTQYL